MGGLFSKRRNRSQRQARAFDNFRARMNAQAVPEPFCPEQELRNDYDGLRESLNQFLTNFTRDPDQENQQSAVFSMLNQVPVLTHDGPSDFTRGCALFRTPLVEPTVQRQMSLDHSDIEWRDLLPVDFDTDMFDTNENEDSSSSSFHWGSSPSSINSDILLRAEFFSSDSSASDEEIETRQVQQDEPYEEEQEQQSCSSSSNSKECDICLDKKKNTAFNPCGHGACAKCSTQLRVCHICRKPIQSKLKLYL